ncbi:TPA: hypothetical protein KW045_005197 [Escherichia coli]|nr:hypothetical protein [Escherichia coli]
MNILYTESSPNIGGQELQAIAQMCAIRRLGQEEIDARYSIDRTVRELITLGRRYRYACWGESLGDDFYEN